MNCVSQSIPSEMGEKHEQKHAGVFREVKWRSWNACLVKFYGSLLVGYALRMLLMLWQIVCTVEEHKALLYYYNQHDDQATFWLSNIKASLKATFQSQTDCLQCSLPLINQTLRFTAVLETMQDHHYSLEAQHSQIYSLQRCFKCPPIVVSILSLALLGFTVRASHQRLEEWRAPFLSHQCIPQKPQEFGSQCIMSPFKQLSNKVSLSSFRVFAS